MTTWGDIYCHHLAKGEDHGSAAYMADQWEKRETQKSERLKVEQIERNALKKQGTAAPSPPSPDAVADVPQAQATGSDMVSVPRDLLGSALYCVRKHAGKSSATYTALQPYAFGVEEKLDDAVVSLIDACNGALSCLGPDGYLPDFGLQGTRKMQAALRAIASHSAEAEEGKR